MIADITLSLKSDCSNALVNVRGKLLCLLLSWSFAVCLKCHYTLGGLSHFTL
ncbi:hypothetical protein JHK86_016868 [Glycine max]|nr:hypothetical protein JHK86_016868 [Glycine max]